MESQRWLLGISQEGPYPKTALGRHGVIPYFSHNSCRASLTCASLGRGWVIVSPPLERLLKAPPLAVIHVEPISNPPASSSNTYDKIITDNNEVMTMLKLYRYVCPSFDAQDDEDEYIVFASSLKEASEVFVNALAHDPERFGWTGEELERFEAAGHQWELEEVLTGDVTGLGIYSREEGWRIITIYQLIGADEPDG
jgi:hypothetical protein